MARMSGPETSVDTPLNQSVSFAPPNPSRPATRTDPWNPVAVGPGRPGAGPANHGALDGMTGYPIQPAKVQRPPLRDETLARDRLLDWVAAKIHHRVVLILADAGYGKTTLLADFSRRTRIRTLWYRLDDDDRDWMSFLSHLVAAGREHDPGFAPRTTAMLTDLAMGGPTREAATNVFLAELPSIAEHGAVLILDDFHLVDESAEVRLITRELVAHAPERLSIIFASRHGPSIPLARLRAAGEVAEIGTDDLRFDASETARLFTETYGRDLEPDVIADVAARTEGWAASLQLVQAALRDRSPGEIRRFVRSLTGADQELYDYLAEEVVGDLEEDLQRFLMRTSILQVVSADLAAVVADVDEADVSRLTAAAERLTLLSRPSRSSRGPQRYHPLVREFLESRLRSTIGDAAVAQLHHQVAEAARNLDWRIAAYHFREAGDHRAMAGVIVGAIPEIMSAAAYVAASEFIDQTPAEMRPSGFGVVEARVRMQHGDYEGALKASDAVLSSDPMAGERDHALLNLLTFHLNTGNVVEAETLASELKRTTADANLKLIAEAARLSIEAGGTAGDLDQLADHLEGMASSQRGKQNHYFGVTMLNRALVSIHQDRPRQALVQLEDAAMALEATSAWIETAATLVLRAATLAQLGKVDEATALSAITLRRPELRAEPDLLLEAAEYEDSYGDPSRTRGLLEEAESAGRLTAKHKSIRALIGARYMIRRRRFVEAQSLLESSSPAGGTSPAFGVARLIVDAHLAAAIGANDAGEKASAASEAAQSLRAHRWRRAAELLRAYSSSAEDLSTVVTSIGAEYPWHLTFFADLLVQRTDVLTTTALVVVQRTMTLYPGKWRHELRTQLERSSGQFRLRTGRLLESVGDETDIRRLRDAGRDLRRLAGASELGRGLARRLAPLVMVEDLGRISVRVGHRVTPGTNIRRRVLALLAFLLTRPDFSSTRDQVLDALWPDLGPDLAMNSLNQTVYFMRRVFEEEFNDDLSPGYLHHDSEVIWLDRELVSSASALCAQTIREMNPDPTPDEVERLSEQYKGRFGLDFEYEEWAHSFRDWLHASYLQVVEHAVAADLGTGHFDRGIRIARRALEVDDSAESVEVSLLRLYRVSGAHAAAAEQYGHYAARLKEELDLEAPPLESI
jgi:DNA-binding SARP family transcriptional activator